MEIGTYLVTVHSLGYGQTSGAYILFKSSQINGELLTLRGAASEHFTVDFNTSTGIITVTSGSGVGKVKITVTSI